MATYTKQPSSKDNHIYKGAPDDKYGSWQWLTVLNAAIYCQRVILEFDISDLPEGASIVSAKLKLYYYHFEPLYGGATAEGRTYWAYKQTHTDWVESESSWNEYKSGSNWTAAGGDWVTSDPSGGSAVVPGSYGWMEWDIKAIVEDAIANHSSIVELLVKDASDLEAGSPWENAYFRSRNYNADPSLRPKIEIEYTPALRPYGLVV